MSMVRRLTAAAALATAMLASSLSAASPASAAPPPGVQVFTGYGISSIPQIALINAQNQARNLAYAAGYPEPFIQCANGASWVTQPMPNFYSAQAQIICAA
ncbi:hypothetical protein O7602_09105 [Micromonospora sp. WMMD1128]|uniref:hypothetical protein n=1 Tax=Micromonospora sp. WMMD1128 TaxID=3015150 RepID=UPI00248AE91C|nr:hypothetical protein [Micromonospora sp. WMMD1128]WBB75640.1 hypothetical protein O7602_09105 [Micromonospora sp. WMMD1128]